MTASGHPVLPGNWQSYRDQLSLDANDGNAQFLPAVVVVVAQTSQASELIHYGTSNSQREDATEPKHCPERCEADFKDQARKDEA